VRAPALLALLATGAAAQSWVLQNSGTEASLRGVWAANDKVVWASGTRGTYLKTSNGGATWMAAAVPGAEALDFRDVHALDDRTAWLMSIGTGESSRIYRTIDGGAHWDLQFTNPDAKGFFDNIAFWDARRGIVAGDAVEGHLVVFTTDDGGAHWERRQTPPAVPNEGAFAASGTSLIARDDRDAWIVTGGTGAARSFHSGDGGRTWTVNPTPIRNDGPSAGIFSIAFSDSLHGVIVGGDYNQAAATERNIAVTSDGGKTWTAPAGTPPAGFRSAVAYLPDRKVWIATGPSGSDISIDGGTNWRTFDSGAFNAMSFASSAAGWAVGPRGRIAKFK